ncbi:cellulase [Luteimonas sp. R10]|uniref:cellulase n=1 Tax=Luteimonas sp. R10 TaxID=3108176 RepID=UPI003087F612|nr:cellulase [Luteimonas sp. R10]
MPATRFPSSVLRPPGPGAVLAGLLALLLLVGAPSQALAEQAPYRWRNVAIGGGGFVTGLVFHPSEEGLLYARTDVGGAYRWEAAERHWIPLTDWIGHEDANLTGIESLALDPSDPERLYLAAGTYTHERAGNGAILRSADRGATFERSDLPFKLGGNELGRGNGERLAVDPNDGRVLLLGSRAHGLWRSADRGASWNKVDAFPALAESQAATAENTWRRQHIGVVFVAFDPDSGKAGAPTPWLYAGVSTREASLYASEDGGASWRALPGQPTGLRPNHMVRDARGDWLVSYGDEPGPDAMHDGALWRYSPADGSWTEITPAPQSTDTEGDGFGWGAVAADPRDPDTIVATTFGRFGPHDDVFRSTDGGETWQPVFPRSEFDHSAWPWTAQATPHWMADIEIDPFDPDRVWFVTGYGLWASHDMTAFERGDTVHWRFEDAGLEETVPLALVSPPQGPHLISGLGDIDGFVHDDLDRTTVQFAAPPRYSNTESLAFAGQAPQVMVRSGHLHDPRDGVVLAAYSRDGGRSWTMFAGEPPQGEGAGHIAVAADGERVIWRPRNAGHWRSDDFGKRWQRVEGLPDTVVVEADRVDAARWYGFDPASGRFYVSDGGGAGFKEAARATGEAGERARPQLRPAPGHAGLVYVAASRHGLLRWNAGRLERLPDVGDARAIGLGKPKDGSETPTLFLFGEVRGEFGLYRSDDDGRRWLRIDDDAHRFGSLRSVAGDPRLYGRVYLATGGRGILYGDPR